MAVVQDLFFKMAIICSLVFPKVNCYISNFSKVSSKLWFIYRSIHPSNHYLYLLRVVGNGSLWTGHQSITGLNREEEQSTFTFTTTGNLEELGRSRSIRCGKNMQTSQKSPRFKPRIKNFKLNEWNASFSFYAAENQKQDWFYSLELYFSSILA